MSEQRIAELGTKIAYHEVSIQELDKAVLNMQKHIDSLEATCQVLKGRMREISTLVPGLDTPDEKPPHY